jgi:2-polyprenyl-6-methoxyphenol hydroxylase-like FAD-dependent oxidoreductase
MEPNNETVIVGGGPAGMLLAWLLVRGGQRVHVVERHPDFAREFRGEGIQNSVVRLLRELGWLEELLALDIARPARAARVFLDDRPAATLEGEGDEPDFGIILLQERFLAWLNDKLQATGLCRVSFSTAGEAFDLDEAGRATRLHVRRGAERDVIEGRAFIVAAGRGTGLRKRLQLPVRSVDTHFNILWMRLPRPADEALVPDGFRAYLTGDALFILYVAADGGLQVAWSRRDERGLKERSFERRKELLLRDAPAPLLDYLRDAFTADTPTHFLRVQSDRAERWFKNGVLFIGDAAHTMSPVAGQGINLAMRDAVVAANLLLAARAEGRELDDELGARFQALREPEVAPMQLFQRRLGYFMLGAPRWQVRAFFRVGLPVLDFLGVRRRLLRRVQSGVTQLRIEPLPALLASPTPQEAAS